MFPMSTPSHAGFRPAASTGSGWLVLRGAKGNNLQSLDAAIPVGLFTCVTGVSGSGKSTLIQDTLYPRLLYVEDPDDRGALRNEDDVGPESEHILERSAG